MDGFFARGGAVALLTIGVALPAVAQGGGSGASAGATRVRRDTVVRLDDATTRLQLDSIRVLMRAIDGEPALSENGMKLRRELEAIMATIRMAPTRTRILFGSKSGGPATTFEFHTRGWIGITTGDAPMTHEISPSGYFVRLRWRRRRRPHAESESDAHARPEARDHGATGR